MVVSENEVASFLPFMIKGSPTDLSAKVTKSPYDLSALHRLVYIVG